jgi:hypothetical protein
MQSNHLREYKMAHQAGFVKGHGILNRIIESLLLQSMAGTKSLAPAFAGNSLKGLTFG